MIGDHLRRAPWRGPAASETIPTAARPRAGATPSPGPAAITPSECDGDITVFRLERLASSWVARWLGVGRARRVWLALVVWCRAAQLDRQLAAGASPQSSPWIGLRAQRITGRRSRGRVAGGLARALSRAEDITPGTAATWPHRQEVFAARIVLRALDRRLRAPEPVMARGVAMLKVLLTDGASPLYRLGEPGALGSHLRAAAAALEPTPNSMRLTVREAHSTGPRGTRRFPVDQPF